MHVVVLDKATFPRDKCCGDGLTAGALRLLEHLGLDPGSVSSWTPVHDVLIRAAYGRSTELRLPDGPGVHSVVARRMDLDAALVDLAAASGAAVRTGVGITGLSQDGDRVTVETTGGSSIEAAYVIGADGMWSPTRRLSKAVRHGYRGEWHAFRQYLSGVTGPGSTQMAVWFEPDMLPGYAWSFPLGGGSVNLGLCVRRGDTLDGSALAAMWAHLTRRPHIREHLGPDAVPEATRKAWPIPACIDQMPLHSGRVLFVGDAAAATDVLTGEGIGQALQTGIYAAEAIAGAGLGDPVAARRSYSKRVESDLVPDHRMSTLLARALSHRKGTEAAVAIIDASAWGRAKFARWLFEDEPRAVLLTPHRWHARFLSREGAFAR